MACTWHAIPGEETCDATWTDQGVTIRCTRPKGHAKDHAYCRTSKCLIARWPQREPGAEVVARVAHLHRVGVVG